MNGGWSNNMNNTFEFGYNVSGYWVCNSEGMYLNVDGKWIKWSATSATEGYFSSFEHMVSTVFKVCLHNFHLITKGYNFGDLQLKKIGEPQVQTVQPQFTVINEYTLTTFIRKINELMEQGWKLHDGITVLKDDEGGVHGYIQALTKN
jgi:hypothetical protein